MSAHRHTPLYLHGMQDRWLARTTHAFNDHSLCPDHPAKAAALLASIYALRADMDTIQRLMEHRDSTTHRQPDLSFLVQEFHYTHEQLSDFEDCIRASLASATRYYNVYNLYFRLQRRVSASLDAIISQYSRQSQPGALRR